jgi:hypothetical protein
MIRAQDIYWTHATEDTVKKKSSLHLIIGLVILVAGAAVLVYGYVAYTDVRASFGGALAHAITGGSKAETQSVIEMICGGALVVIGLGVMLLLGRRRR